MELHFYYDVVCPYAYLASTRVEALAARTGADLRWHPVLLGGIYRSVGQVDQPSAAVAEPKAKLNALDLHRQAERLGVTLNFHPSHPRRSVEAMRLLVAADEAVRPALSHALYQAYWVDNEDVSDEATLERIAAAHDVDPGLFRTPEAKQALFDTTADAVERGFFGVPGFRVGGEMWWGVDRLHFVERALGGDPDRGAEPDDTGATLTFFHDFASPFSYLASTQVQRVADEAGARLEWAPFLLGALFKEIGTPIVPMAAMNQAKRTYYLKDMLDWARWWGVPMKYPSHFPFHTVTALRAALVEPGITPHVYRAAWVDDRDISDTDVLARVIDDAGFDGRALVERTRDPEVKGMLFETTARAKQAGACGAPTFLVDGEVLFWGQDRIWMVEDALRGWRPSMG